MAIQEQFLIQVQGQTYVTYPGLLDEATAVGIRSLDTELLQIPSAANDHVAIVKATVVMDDVAQGTGEPRFTQPRRFTGIADASPENVHRGVAQHLIRVCETRAKARALRDAINVAVAVDESEAGVEAGVEAELSSEEPVERTAVPGFDERREIKGYLQKALEIREQLPENKQPPEVDMKVWGSASLPRALKLLEAMERRAEEEGVEVG